MRVRGHSTHQEDQVDRETIPLLRVAVQFLLLITPQVTRKLVHAMNV